jgi:hypothetical protein
VVHQCVVTKEHYIASKANLDAYEFVTNLDHVTAEEWEASFAELDVLKNGVISFEELCYFTIEKMNIQPTDFLNGVDCEIIINDHTWYVKGSA